MWTDVYRHILQCICIYFAPYVIHIEISKKDLYLGTEEVEGKNHNSDAFMKVNNAHKRRRHRLSPASSPSNSPSMSRPLPL